MKIKRISVATARKLAVNAQLLDGKSKLSLGKEGVAQAIEKLGYVQIDTISVVQRAHHHTLWTRCPGYHPDMLDELQATDRRIFEYWAHAHSYVPMKDYRFYLPKMRSAYDPKTKWDKERMQNFSKYFQPVLERIKSEGPLSTSDFKTHKLRKGAAPWEAKPEKFALDMLLTRGELMITRRHNFERIYDLTERVLPKDINKVMPGNDELGRFLVRRALSAHGLAREKDIAEHIEVADKSIISKSLVDLIDAGEVLPVTIKEEQSTTYYALPEMLHSASKSKKATTKMLILSPFDNFTILRDRMLKLFDFDYALECYKPAAKRLYGFFVLPVLWNEQFIARVDAKAERKSKTLRIINFILENNNDDFDEMLPALTQAFKGFLRFNQCEKLHVERIEAKGKVRAIKKHIAAATSE